MSLTPRISKEDYFPVRFLSISLALFVLLLPDNFGVFGQVIGTCSVATYLAVGGFAIQNSRIKQFLDWAGDRSYSIYLIHLPVIYILTRTYVFQGMQEMVRYLFSIVIIFVLSNGTYQFVESPYRKKGRFPVNRQSVMKLLIYFVLVPLFLLGALRMGSVSYYWKFDSPSIQGTIECANVGNNGECESGDIQSKDVFVLIGDSHAAAISQSFANAARSVGAKAVFFSGRGCQVLEFRENQQLYPSETCRSYTFQMAQYLKTHKVNRVFVMQRSSSIQEVIPQNTYLSSILKGLVALKRETQHITVIGPTPEFQKGFGQGTIKELIKGNGWQERKNLLGNSFTDDAYYKKNLPQNGIDYLPTTDIFCTKLLCQFLDKNGYLYWDNNHLSLTGADRLTRMLASEFAKNLKG